MEGEGDVGGHVGYVECRGCHAQTGDSREAIAAWNRRVAPAPPSDEAVARALFDLTGWLDEDWPDSSEAGCARDTVAAVGAAERAAGEEKPMNAPFPIVTPGQCGTFTLTDKEKRAMFQGAQKAKARRAREMPDSKTAISRAFSAWQRLQELGWRDARYAPCDRSPLLLIEPGSTGIHHGTRDAGRRFWIVDGDTWPASPMLFKLDEAPDAR